MDVTIGRDEREIVLIGELASWAGVTPRTVRHYHSVGLLPEVSRTSSGYREYTMSDLMRMLRIRRLVELGFRLDEIRPIIAESQGQLLDDALDELDRHLAVQQRLIADQRDAIAALRSAGDDDPRQLIGVVGALATAVDADEVDVALESWLLATVGSIAGMSTTQVRKATAGTLHDAEQLQTIRSVVGRFAALAGADVDIDQREIAQLADDIAGPAATPDSRSAWPADAASVLRAMASELTPAQARCLDLMIARMHSGAS
jgi:DNA-binding transcriptional MerR regulator